ncbi:MAG: hypothetical protein PVJ67_02250 [Candidatus Pacearchaeota archaeon]|jgi:hypothetical protein
MTIKNLFRKKITGKALEGLTKLFDFDWGNPPADWSRFNHYAKLEVTPKEDGILLTAYFESKLFHREYNAFGKGYEDIERNTSPSIRSIKIPYDQIKQ